LIKNQSHNFQHYDHSEEDLLQNIDITV